VKTQRDSSNKKILPFPHIFSLAFGYVLGSFPHHVVCVNTFSEHQFSEYHAVLLGKYFPMLRIVLAPPSTGSGIPSSYSSYIPWP